MSWATRTIRSSLFGIVDAIANGYCHQGRHHFLDRSTGSDRLVMILAGWKEALWPATLARIARFAPAGPAGLDVCLVCPGRRSDALDRWAANHGWSVLTTASRRPGLGLNLAVARHPQARWLFKLDEDIVIGEGFFDRLIAGHQRIEDEGSYRLGFLAPLLNLNGHGYVPFLRLVGQDRAFAERFQGLPRACGGIPVFHDAAAARFIWEVSLPFDGTAELAQARPWEWSAIPHRFSIGAILVRRDRLLALGGFRRSLLGPILGHDEDRLCTACMIHSLIMACDHGVFAGHLGFAPQEAGLRDFLPTLIPRLLPP